MQVGRLLPNVVGAVLKLLDFQNVTKRFNGAVALDAVAFDLREGEVHVLFGENGAGKSTLINLAAGSFAPDGGRILLGDRDIGGLSPALIRQAGISVVFQEFSLVPQMTVTENMFLGRETKRGIRVDHRAMRAAAGRRLAVCGFDVAPDRIVGDLTRAEQQMVEIAKALLVTPRILILDEPTASLTEAEAANLFRLIAELKAQGVGIVYVSHRMQEIRALADRVTVLRDGQRIATVAASDASDDELVSLMSGRPLDRLFPEIPCRAGKVRLSARALSLANGAVASADLDVRAGEIVGVGGLVGSGQSDFARALFGLEPIRAGTVAVDGKVVDDPQPARMLDAKVTYFPADRAVEGLALSRPVRENASITALWLKRFARRGRLDRRAERDAAAAVADRLGLRPRNIEAPVAMLSGGNRQKVLLARGLMRPTSIYLFDEPTVGIDVGAKMEVYRLMADLVAEGCAILIVSSDLQELLHLSHRLVIFRDGRVAAELTGAAITEANALAHFFADQGQAEPTGDRQRRVANG